MWRDIALANRTALLVELDRYGDALTRARALRAAADGEGLAALFLQASAARREWERRRTHPVARDGD